ncbi:hypothetical protein ACIRP3_21315 [Streptomyces sp. NPDC101209]|uniref:hypothetical protein n=1 Tax=Streptomyces sp. NPDC101209 TaxID=3366129 RepID=UPI00382E5276
MRRVGACWGAVVSTVAAVAMCGAPAAHADGGRDVPDVAMVVAGGTGRTTVLRPGEAAFACLRRLLAPTYTGTERVPEDWTEGRYPPVHLTVVWGLSGVGGWPQTDRAPGGDVAVERQDQLLVAADGTPWIRSDPAPEVRDDDIRWHRAPRSVFVELERQKVLSGLGDAGNSAGGSTGARSTGAGNSVRWGLSGLGAGLVAGVGGMLLLRRAAARHAAGPPRDEPRQELIDL